MSEDASWEDLHPGESTDAGNTFPACTPEQDKALARLRALSPVHVQSAGLCTCMGTGFRNGKPCPECQEWGNNQVPGNVLRDWARIDQERAELERLFRLQREPGNNDHYSPNAGQTKGD